MPPRLTARQSQHARQIARSERAEEGWLGNSELLTAWPTRSHTALGNIRAVPSGVRVLGDSIPTDEIITRHLAANAATNRILDNNATDSRVLAGIQGNDNAGNNNFRAINTGHIQDGANTLRTMNSSSVSEDRLTSGLTGGANESGPAQGGKGVRKIGTSLGGTSQAASAGDHSHSAGNSMNIDRIPVEDQRSILAYRKSVVDAMANVDTMDLIGLRAFVRDLAVVASAAFAFAADAPDMDADERLARRDAGEDVPLNWEFRETKRREEAGVSVDRGDSFFAGQKHYAAEGGVGKAPKSIRPPGVARRPFEPSVPPA